MKTALIGLGYWGPNIARNLKDISDLTYIVDSDINKIKKVADTYGSVGHPDADIIWSDPNIEAVVIATPPATHHGLAKEALEAGKHVFVEKPLTDVEPTARDLYELAREYPNQVCCVGHIFMFSPEVLEVKRRIDKGDIGNLKLINIYRLNLGRYQSCGIKMDLFPHDVSIIQYLAGANPIGLSCTMAKFDGIESMGTAQFGFKGSEVKAMLNVSWVHTEKIRKVIAIGDRGTIEYDMNSPHMLTHFKDRFIEHNQPGNIKVIEVRDHSEPLRAELQYFLDLAGKTGPIKDQDNRISFKNGHAVVKAISELRNTNG